MDIDLVVRVITLALIAVTQLLDWHSTRAFLKSGRGYETTQWLARLQARIGVDAAMALKGAAHVAAGAALLWLLPPLAVLAGLAPFLFLYVRIIRKNYRIAGGKA